MTADGFDHARAFDRYATAWRHGSTTRDMAVFAIACACADIEDIETVFARCSPEVSELIRSWLAQREEEWEAIVFDDGQSREISEHDTQAFNRGMHRLARLIDP